MTLTLRAHNLSYCYKSGGHILQDWSATFEPGEITAITGKSGKGKSTLLYILGLMLRPNNGTVSLSGIHVSRLKDIDRAKLRANNFGFVFQDAALDSTRTVLDNVIETALYRKQQRKLAIPKALHLLERFEVDVPAHHKPGQVSGGQAQRIALCRAMLGDPPILLADEPTGNLDTATTDLIMSAFREYSHRGNTVVLVTHSPRVASQCDSEIRL